MIHLLLAILCVALPLHRRQDPAQDAARDRIAAAVAVTGLSYQKSPSGLSYVFVYENGERRQSVYVAISPSAAGARQTHAIYTTVWSGKEPPSDELMRKVFAKTKKFGSYYLFTDKQGVWSIRFGTHLDATAMPAQPAKDDPGVLTLRSLIAFVNQVGEETDKELNGDSDIR